jgi:uncharacterized protein (TIGR03435 family)
MSFWRCGICHLSVMHFGAPRGRRTTHLRFDPIELLERLASLTPRPRINLVLYYGVLGAHAEWRRPRGSSRNIYRFPRSPGGILRQRMPISCATLSLAASLGFLITSWLATETLVAQSPSAVERRFDVASVKVSPPLNDRIAQAARAGGPPPTVYDMRTLPGGRFTATMASLKMLVGYAFDVRDYQIEGGPRWLTTDYFDIAATANSDATPAEVRTMLRALLTERFRVRVRLATRQAPVHVLTVARRDGRLGPELKRTTPECARQIEERKKDIWCDFRMAPGPNGGMMARMNGVEPERLVSLISSSVAAPVIDRTGLTGRFDLTLEYMPERDVAAGRPGLDPNSLHRRRWRQRCSNSSG